MSTSNLVKAIGTLYHFVHEHNLMSSNWIRCSVDCAFVDRADIIQYIDLPPREAIYEILRTCLAEIVKKAIVNAIVGATTIRSLPVHQLFL